MTTNPQLIHLAVYDRLADWETGHATAHINQPMYQRRPGRYEVVTVGATGDPVTTMGGTTIVPDVALDDLSPDHSAMLIMPGGAGWDEGGLGEFAAKAGEFLTAGVPVAAICGATLGLARTGLLDEYDHTSSSPDYLALADQYAGGGRYRDELAVTDRNLITAGGTAPVEFAREVMAALALYEPHVLDAWYRLYALHEADAYYVLASAA